MKLQVCVVGLEDASKFRNKKPRVTFKVLQADSMFAEFTVGVESLIGAQLGGIYPLAIEGLELEPRP